jgi:hypothetical protein
MKFSTVKEVLLEKVKRMMRGCSNIGNDGAVQASVFCAKLRKTMQYKQNYKKAEDT